MKTFFVIAAVALGAVACGGATDDTLVDGGSDGSSEAAPDGGPDTSGPYPCGSTTCGSGQYCIHPCCGGAPPPCVPYDDGGTCPQDYTPSTACWNLSNHSGCEPPACTPPPPYCTSSPPSLGCESNGTRDCYEACG